MLYYLRIAQIRNGRFLAEVLSDVMRKKISRSRIGAAAIQLVRVEAGFIHRYGP